VDDFKKAFLDIHCSNISSGKIEQLFRQVDADGDGRVSFKDFENVMKY
jgi:Ca2+-binding EF-hand superfamily protein